MNNLIHLIVDFQQRGRVMQITFNKPKEGNVINDSFLSEMLFVLNKAENDDTILAVVMCGKDRVFCKGLDFKEAYEEVISENENHSSEQYMKLLNKIHNCKKTTIAQVNGEVIAGGIGIVAACDLVYADEKSTFSLPEILWGLIPACVAPFLVRRVGIHKAYKMMLSTETITASKAYEIGLVDEVFEYPEKLIRQLLSRLARIHPDMIGELKQYMSQMDVMINEEMKQIAVHKTKQLLSEKRVKKNIRDFVTKNAYPWEQLN